MTLAVGKGERRSDVLYTVPSVTAMGTGIGTASPGDVPNEATSVQLFNAGNVINMGMHIMNAHTIVRLCFSWQN